MFAFGKVVGLFRTSSLPIATDEPICFAQFWAAASDPAVHAPEDIHIHFGRLARDARRLSFPRPCVLWGERRNQIT